MLAGQFTTSIDNMAQRPGRAEESALRALAIWALVVGINH
jgi:hypothetical protein